MILPFRKISKGMIFFVLATQLYAHGDNAIIVAENCLIKHLPQSAKVLTSTNALSAIELPENTLESLKIDAHKAHCGGFKNVTDKGLNKKALQAFISTAPKAQIATKTFIKGGANEEQIRTNIDKVEGNHIWDTLTSLTHFDDRSANSDSGVKAVHFMKAQFEALALDAKRQDTDSFLVESGWRYKQPSLVTVMGKDIKADAVVIGAHIDTLSYQMPGADDDGSGSAGLLEIARVMMNSNKPLKHPIYFIWYAAEERGLIGSEHVVQYFKENKIPVKAVLHFDMTGYRYKNQETMYVLDDNVSSSLTMYLKGLITDYIGVKVGTTHCGYACSDHASWHDAGYPSACPFEADHWAGQDNPYIHTSNDTMEYVSLDHMVNFTKLGVAFASDLAY